MSACVCVCVSYSCLITQSERVEGAHGEEFSVRSPGHCGDGVIMSRAGEEQPAVAVPHLQHTQTLSVTAEQLMSNVVLKYY